ncbi:MFS transporter [Micromonospora chersina]|uniref:MFS transporter n=1 Tax=Micromonospora chersina TaxID=47854 RepID=UPI0033C5B6C2
MDSDIRASRHEGELGKAEPDPRRWTALIVLGLINFIQVLDVTVVNVALPRIKEDLGFSQAGLAWVVNSYVIMAGGLLLLGGRLADIFGRRRLFLIGVGVFAVASAVSGAAVNPGMLVGGRFVQGIGEALAAPAALGLIALIFPDPGERMKALGIWGGISGVAGVTGVVISGVLTDLASWRWLFYINVPIALLALLMVPRLVSESRMVREHKRLDFPGAVTATGGLIAVVYGLLQAAEHPWGSSRVLVPLLGGLALLAVMLLIESRSKDPLIPLRFFHNRTRLVANLVALFFLAGFISYIFLLTLFEQQVLNFSPLRGGLAYLPFGISMGVGIGLGAGLMPKLGVKPILAAGFFGAALGLFLTSGIDVGASYASHVLPGMIVFGLSSGAVAPAIANAALHKVTGQDASLASGVQQAVQQVGSALGLAFLVTFALRHAADKVAAGASADAAATSGYVLSFRIAAVLMIVAAVLVLILLERVSAQPRNPHMEGAMPNQPESAEPTPASGSGAEREPSGS